MLQVYTTTLVCRSRSGSIDVVRFRSDLRRQSVPSRVDKQYRNRVQRHAAAVGYTLRTVHVFPDDSLCGHDTEYKIIRFVRGYRRLAIIGCRPVTRPVWSKLKHNRGLGLWDAQRFVRIV